MTKIDTVAIHHEDLDVESWVPPSTLDHWLARGWTEGRLPRLQEAADRAAQADRVAAQRAAEAWAATHPDPEQLEDEPVQVDQHPADSGPPTAPAEVVEQPPIASRRGHSAASETVPAEVPDGN